MAGLEQNMLGEGVSPLEFGADRYPRMSHGREDYASDQRNGQRAKNSRIELRIHVRSRVPGGLRWPSILRGRVAIHNDRVDKVHPPAPSNRSHFGSLYQAMVEETPGRSRQRRERDSADRLRRLVAVAECGSDRTRKRRPVPREVFTSGSGRIDTSPTASIQGA